MQINLFEHFCSATQPIFNCPKQFERENKEQSFFQQTEIQNEQ